MFKVIKFISIVVGSGGCPKVCPWCGEWYSVVDLGGECYCQACTTIIA